jgi:hypothetical protein
VRKPDIWIQEVGNSPPNARFPDLRFLFLAFGANRIAAWNWAVRAASVCRHHVCMVGPRRARRQIASVHDRNGDGICAPKRYDSGSKEAAEADRIVVDDWPEEVPITASEVDVLGAFLGEMLDTFLRPRQ